MRFLLIVLIVAGAVSAQELSGTVRDASGLAVPRAAVTVTGESSGARYAARSGEAGQFHVLGLTGGRYTVTVERAGFRMYRVSGLTVREGEAATLSVTLDVSEASGSIRVIGEAPASFHLDETKAVSVPLDGRNFIPLIALSPGVALPGGGSLLPRINGSRPRTNEYLYDGISALQPEPGQVAFYPIPDAIEEFHINLNSYSAEYGRSNGGTVIVNMKQGGNQLHGTLFEFFRNEALNARNYFAPAGGKPEFRRNQFGLAVGGPIQMDKTFFFVDWQSTRLRTGITRFSTVPTAAQRQSVPASRLDPVAAAVLARYPAANLPGAANNYVRTGVEPDDQDQFDARLDRQLSRSQRAFVRYSRLGDADTPVTPLPDGSGAIAAGVIGHTVTKGSQVAVEHAWAPGAASFNQLRLGYTRRTTNVTAPAAGPTYTVAGFQQIGSAPGASARTATSVTELLDTLALVRGKHTVKLGVDFRREAIDALAPANPNGLFTFSALGSNNALTSFLQGQVSAYSIDVQGQPLQERAHVAEFFVSDEWKPSGRIAIDAGVRYTLNFPSTEVHNRGAVFNLKTQVLDFPHAARELECCDFGPRLGIAYRIGETWTARAGYGMVWFEQTGITTPFTLPQFPFVQTVGRQSPDNVTPAFTLANGPAVQAMMPDANAGLGQGVFGVQRDNGSGYSQQWNFTLQNTLGRSVSVELGYLGSKNTRLGLPEANLNQLPAELLSLGPALLTKVANPYYGEIPAGSSLGGPLIARQQLLRAFPRFTNVALFRNNVGNSTYEAAYAKVEKRFAKGLTFTLAYTFSKLIDDASSYFSQSIFTGPVLNNTGAADAFNRRLEKDVSSGDIPRVFSAGWVYEIPRWWKVSGVLVAGLVRVQAGDAVPVSQATNLNASLGFAVQRPNRVGNPNDFAGRSAAAWFNTGAFTGAPQFTLGNSSRNPVRGPGLQEADLMVGKIFRLTERVGLEVRAEAFNVSNTPPLGDPSGIFGTAAFGSITSAGNPRVFEGALKVHF